MRNTRNRDGGTCTCTIRTSLLCCCCSIYCHTRVNSSSCLSRTTITASIQRCFHIVIHLLPLIIITVCRSLSYDHHTGTRASSRTSQPHMTTGERKRRVTTGSSISSAVSVTNTRNDADGLDVLRKFVASNRWRLHSLFSRSGYTETYIMTVEQVASLLEMAGGLVCHPPFLIPFFTPSVIHPHSAASISMAHFSDIPPLCRPPTQYCFDVHDPKFAVHCHDAGCSCSTMSA